MVYHSKPSELSGMTVTITVKEGKDLIAKDRNLLGKRTTSDPYVELYAGTKSLGKTKVVKKDCSPKWNEQFQMELGADDANAVLNSKRTGHFIIITFLLFDYDRNSSDDSMGTCEIVIDPLTKTASKWIDVKSGKTSSPHFCKNAKGQIHIGVSCSAKQMNELKKGQSKVLEYNRIRVGLAWDTLPPEPTGLTGKAKNIDLDCSCVAMSQTGEVLMDETVYYGNLSNSNQSIVHSGDETTGEALGDDEKIFLELDKIPSKVLCLYFLLTVASPEYSFHHVQTAVVRFISTETRHGICRYVPAEAGGDLTCMFLVRMARSPSNPNSWVIAPIEDGNTHARDFGSLIPEIKGYTRDLIPTITVNPEERIAIMRKGGVVRVEDYVPSRRIPKDVTFGLAWDVTEGVNIDLDASAVLMDEQFDALDIVFFKQLTSKDGSIRHSGDEREGDEHGDDEMISVDLKSVHECVKYIVFVINSYSGQELDDVENAACHLYDPKTRIDIASYKMANAAEMDKHTACIMGCLYKDDGIWFLRIISQPAQGKVAHKCVSSIKNYLIENVAQPPYSAPPVMPSIETQMPLAESYGNLGAEMEISQSQLQNFVQPVAPGMASAPVASSVVVPTSCVHSGK